MREPVRCLVRLVIALAAVAILLVIARAISNELWSRWGDSLHETGGASFFVPCAIALALAAWRWPGLRPPWRGPAGLWRSPRELIALIVVLAVIGWLYANQLERATSFGLHAPPITIAFITAVWLGPVVEEWLFRGVLWRALAPTDPASLLPALAALVATSVAFACWHLPFNADAPVVPHAIFGAAMARLRWRFQSIAPGVMLHAVVNTLYFVVS